MTNEKPNLRQTIINNKTMKTKNNKTLRHSLLFLSCILLTALGFTILNADSTTTIGLDINTGDITSTGTITSQDLTIQKSNDTTLTIYSNTDDPTENDKLLIIQKGTTPLELFSVDEDGDVVIGNDLSINNDLSVAGTTTLSGNLNLSQNELKNSVLEKLSSFPSSPVEGQMFWHTDNNKPYWYDDSDDTNAVTVPRWRTDTSGATFVVAASDSQNKEGADYVCSGTDDQVQIQAAIDAVAALGSIGGRIQLSEGIFHTSAAIRIEVRGVSLVGMGNAWTTAGTIIRLSDNSDCNVIEIGKVGEPQLYFPALRDLCINGNGIAQASGHGIVMRGAISDLMFERIGVANCKKNGIDIDLTGGGWMWRFNNVWTEWNYQDGIYNASATISYTHCTISCNARYGGRLAGKNSFDQCMISENRYAGIMQSPGGAWLSVVNSIIEDNSTSGSGVGLIIEGAMTGGAQIRGNRFNGGAVELYAIQAPDVNTSKLLITENIFENHVTSVFDIAGTNVGGFIRNNLGYVTENSDTATLVNGQTSIAVAHGLAVTPVAGDIVVTPIEAWGNMTTYYIGNYTATHFTIYSPINPGVDVDFAWKAIVL